MVTMLVTKLYITIVTYHPWGKSQLRLDVVGLSAGRQSLGSENAKEIAMRVLPWATRLAIKILPVIGGILLGFVANRHQ